jgi:energy-converting hydrogenase A subunit M
MPIKISSYQKILTNGYDFMKILVGLLEAINISRDEVRNVLGDKFSYSGILGYIEKNVVNIKYIFRSILHV